MRHPEKEFTPQEILDDKNHRITRILEQNNFPLSCEDLIRSAENDALLASLLFALDKANAEIAFRQINPGGEKILQIFGTARAGKQHPEYQRIRDLVSRVTRARIAPIINHGGSGGIMEAAGKGAIEGDGTSVGNVMWNDKVTDQKNGFNESGWGINNFIHHLIRFATYEGRKNVMINQADAIVICAALGGGTLDELGDIYTQMQYGKKKPVIIFGDSQTGLKVVQVFESMLAEGAISDHQKVFQETDGEGLLFFEPHDPQKVINFLTNQFTS